MKCLCIRAVRNICLRAAYVEMTGDTDTGRSISVTSKFLPRKSNLVIAHDAATPKTPEQVAAGRAKGAGVRNLNETAVNDLALLPTPRASDGEKGGPNMAGSKGDLMLPSAVNQQWGTPRTSMVQDKDMGKGRLGEQVHGRHPNQGKLNPRWVETLMGLPVGWTMPSCLMPTSMSCRPTSSCWTPMAPRCRPPAASLRRFRYSQARGDCRSRCSTACQSFRR